MERPRRGKGGHRSSWAYGYPELAVLFAMSEGAVRQAVCDDRFDPLSLASVVDFAIARRAAVAKRAAPPTKRSRRREPPTP